MGRACCANGGGEDLIHIFSILPLTHSFDLCTWNSYYLNDIHCSDLVVCILCVFVFPFSLRFLSYTHLVIGLPVVKSALTCSATLDNRHPLLVLSLSSPLLLVLVLLSSFLRRLPHICYTATSYGVKAGGAWSKAHHLGQCDSWRCVHAPCVLPFLSAWANVRVPEFECCNGMLSRTQHQLVGRHNSVTCTTAECQQGEAALLHLKIDSFSFYRDDG
jgi:hypothetical protein